MKTVTGNRFYLSLSQTGITGLCSHKNWMDLISLRLDGKRWKDETDKFNSID